MANVPLWVFVHFRFVIILLLLFTGQPVTVDKLFHPQNISYISFTYRCFNSISLNNTTQQPISIPYQKCFIWLATLFVCGTVLMCAGFFYFIIQFVVDFIITNYSTEKTFEKRKRVFCLLFILFEEGAKYKLLKCYYNFLKLGEN